MLLAHSIQVIQNRVKRLILIRQICLNVTSVSICLNLSLIIYLVLTQYKRDK